MIELLWYAFVVVSCAIALANWRTGLYLGLTLDCLRDPIRKLADGQSVLITLSGVAIWGIIILRAYSEHQDELRKAFARYRHLQPLLTCLALALIPAALMSCLLYRGGWFLAAIGSMSYVPALLGIGLGYMIPRREEDVYGLLRYYTLINSVLLVGVPLELGGIDLPALGGIDHEWVRYRTGYTVALMCGFYRSPDIMGLHAAHVAMFSLMLALQPRRQGRFLWILTALWSVFCLMVSGRRKMIGIPLVFVACYLLLGLIKRHHSSRRLLEVAAGLGLAAAAVALMFNDSGETAAYADYTEYAHTLFTEGASRSNELIVGSSLGTLRYAGLIGAGLGTATQGRHYLNISTGHHTRGWQEDGISRLLLEFGLPGFLLLGCAGLLMLQCLWQACAWTPADSPEQALQLGLLSVVAGNAASYTISHQQFSGDPVTALLTTVMAGMVLGMPRVFAMRRNRQLSLRPALIRRKESGNVRSC